MNILDQRLMGIMHGVSEIYDPKTDMTEVMAQKTKTYLGNYQTHGYYNSVATVYCANGTVHQNIPVGSIRSLLLSEAGLG